MLRDQANKSNMADNLMFWFALLLFTIFCPFVIALLYYVYRRDKENNDFVGKRVLFVTAHPDDECMFFAPAILQLSRCARVYLLCLSAGNYYGLGETRKKELLLSCSLLGIPDDNVTILDNKESQDGYPWNTLVVRKEIESHCRRHNIDALITFDDYGVSGHPNHIALFNAVNTSEDKSESYSNPKSIPVFLLESIFIFRKYSLFLDLANSIFAGYIFLSSLKDFKLAQEAMAAHHSQFVWFRQLYIRFSRYMVINTLERHNSLKFDSQE